MTHMDGVWQRYTKVTLMTPTVPVVWSSATCFQQLGQYVGNRNGVQVGYLDLFHGDKYAVQRIAALILLQRERTTSNRFHSIQFPSKQSGRHPHITSTGAC